MTDVRLTATNPTDSSVVPVACNSRGELLIEEVNIEQIDNEVVINGDLEINPTPAANGGAKWAFSGQAGSLQVTRYDTGTQSHSFSDGGKVRHTRLKSGDLYNVELTDATYSYRQWIGDSSETYTINWNGKATGNGFLIRLEPDNPLNYTQATSKENGETISSYTGPVMDVRQELEFLRSQLRMTMEKLKMTPDGGWEVWDGSNEI